MIILIIFRKIDTFEPKLNPKSSIFRLISRIIDRFLNLYFRQPTVELEQFVQIVQHLKQHFGDGQLLVNPFAMHVASIKNFTG